MEKILFVNHKKKKCGVYEFGANIGFALENSKRAIFKYIECDSFSELKGAYVSFKPSIIIYNYHPQTLSWVNQKNILKIPSIFCLKTIHVGIIHEIHQHLADNLNDSHFDYHIAPDPTLLLKNPIVYKTGRLLLNDKIDFEDLINNPIPVIGSFGFATNGKGFDKIVEQVQNEFDDAIIRINMPFSHFADPNGENAMTIKKTCLKKIYKPGIKLIITNDYYNNEQLLKFLQGNSINVFLYDDGNERGISSVPDSAIVSGRPLAISKSKMFRHLVHLHPSICVEDNSLKKIIDNGIETLKPLWEEWSKEMIIWEYERIVGDISTKYESKSFLKKKNQYNEILKKILNKLGFKIRHRTINNIWTKPEDNNSFSKKRNLNYQPIKLIDGLNVILDNTKRIQYKTAIDFLLTNLPELLNKKIPEANIQQAFVFDTVIRLVGNNKNFKILSIGVFEDSAYEALRLIGYEIDAIDPIINYDLNTFITKPTVNKSSYDVIFATSVIEHVQDDEQFICNIAHLLKVNGTAVLTCDFSNSYKKGDEIPEVDFRYYTKYDLSKRLMNLIPNCRLVDQPIWDYEKTDFVYLNKFHYTFATFVFKRIA